MAPLHVNLSLSLAKYFRLHAKPHQRFYSIIAPEWLGGKSILEKYGRFDFPDHSESFEERMEIVAKEKNGSEPKPTKNIGMELKLNTGSVRDELLEWSTRNNNNKELEKAARHQTLRIPMDEVREDWLKADGGKQIKLVAEYYGVYKDLFGGDYFYPTMNLNICYDHDDDYLVPVCGGNVISPSEASKPPMVEIDSQPQELWTLLMVNPDENLTNQEEEYIHWLVANIPGGDILKGDVLVDYFQPISPKGTGYHRNIFVLFQQKERMDYPEVKRIKGITNLDERHFKTESFFKAHQSQLTPTGLAFFQSQWDESVRHTFRNVLGMKEPSFEFNHPVPYHPPPKKYPHRQPFDVYMDRYRDMKDLDEEVLREKLKKTSPYEPRSSPIKYPLAHMPKKYKPSWLRAREELMVRRINQFKDLD